MPTRTIEIEIKNSSENELKQIAAGCWWGEWRPTGPPPASIAPGQSGKIRAESSGPFEGTEGFVKYRVMPKVSSGRSTDPNDRPSSCIHILG